MLNHYLRTIPICALVLATLVVPSAIQAEDLNLLGGKVKFTVPEGWETVEPRSSIIEAEIKVPAVEGDESHGRLTFMAAGGGIEANIERWKNQFSPAADGSAAKSIIKKTEIADLEVHMVDISGTFKSQPRGPRGPTENVEGQRMLAAIIVLPNGAQYFVKLVGPAKTMEANAEKFNEMMAGLNGE